MQIKVFITAVLMYSTKNFQFRCCGSFPFWNRYK